MTTPPLSDAQISAAPAPARDAAGRLLPGHRMGRPAGSRNRASKVELERLRYRSEAAWRVIDQRLAEGCVKSALWVLSRLTPDARVTEIDVSDPAAVSEAIETGDLTIHEAHKLSATVRALRDTEMMDAMKQRLDTIEALLNSKGRG
ncbi:MAG: hypothetical protein ACJLS3_11230 [Erythrobacter sp.]